jgi:uncharacterized phosphosugar-binding protein
MSQIQLKGATLYMDAIRALLDTIAQTQAEVIDRAATTMVETIGRDGMIYLFGTGHSHMLAEEGHFRAGGLAPVCPIFSASLMLHESAIMSSLMERTSGVVKAVISHYNLKAGDTLVVFSNSGVNAVPVEMAMAGKAIGMTVIAVVSLEYAARAPISAAGRKLNEVADIVIDNCGVQGDALVEIGGIRVAPASTVAGAFILNSIFAEVSSRLADAGVPVPAFISSNVPGANEHNAALLTRYRGRNPHI